jgi:hypothetical protein
MVRYLGVGSTAANIQTDRRYFGHLFFSFAYLYDQQSHKLYMYVDTLYSRLMQGAPPD